MATLALQLVDLRGVGAVEAERDLVPDPQRGQGGSPFFSISLALVTEYVVAVEVLIVTLEAEVLAINDEGRNISLQITLLRPLLAGLLGLANSFRMLRLPDQKPSSPLDGLDLA